MGYSRRQKATRAILMVTFGENVLYNSKIICYGHTQLKVTKIIKCQLPVFAICFSTFNLFSILIGGTTTVQTAGLASELAEVLVSGFSLVSSAKPFSKKGLSWPEESELGEPSTVSQPLSCSSSDILSYQNKALCYQLNVLLNGIYIFNNISKKAILKNK